jgi:hypothetical protein
MLTGIIKNKQIFALLFIYTLIATFIIFFFDGTGDSDDSSESTRRKKAKMQ